MVQSTPVKTSPALLNLVADYFKVLSEVSRLTIIQLLKDNGSLKVGEIAEATGLGQANLSKHLKLLTQAGILQREQIGVSVYYQIADPIIFELCEVVCGSLKNRLIQQAQQLEQIPNFKE